MILSYKYYRPIDFELLNLSRIIVKLDFMLKDQIIVPISIVFKKS